MLKSVRVVYYLAYTFCDCQHRKSTINVFSHWIAFAFNWKGLILVLIFMYIHFDAYLLSHDVCASLNASHGISAFTSNTRQVNLDPISVSLNFDLRVIKRYFNIGFFTVLFRVRFFLSSFFLSCPDLRIFGILLAQPLPLHGKSLSIYLLALLVFTLY